MWESCLFNATMKCYSAKPERHSHLFIPTEILRFSVSADPAASRICRIPGGNDGVLSARIKFVQLQHNTSALSAQTRLNDILIPFAEPIVLSNGYVQTQKQLSRLLMSYLQSNTNHLQQTSFQILSTPLQQCVFWNIEVTAAST